MNSMPYDAKNLQTRQARGAQHSKDRGHKETGSFADELFGPTPHTMLKIAEARVADSSRPAAFFKGLILVIAS
jgi:hypothetical protein